MTLGLLPQVFIRALMIPIMFGALRGQKFISEKRRGKKKNKALMVFHPSVEAAFFLQ